MAKKCILILLDGLGDRPCTELDNKTPLQAARTPVLDAIATDGASGLYHAGIVGQAMPSENAHFAIFGYDTRDFPGRGALEALGAGIHIEKEDVAILAHFVSLKKQNDTLWLVQNKPTLSIEESRAFFSFCGSMDVDNIRFQFTPTHSFRGILTLKGSVSPFITDTDPFMDDRPLIEPEPLMQYAADGNARKTADALKQYILQVNTLLENHPINEKRRTENSPLINGIVTQRPGQLKSVKPFQEKWGLKGCILSAGIVYRGLGRFLGFDHKDVTDTDDPGDDLARRIQMASRMIKDYDFIHVHTKVPDEAAHTKQPIAKKTTIEALDRGIGKAIQPLLEDPDTLLVIASDHSTPSSTHLVHSGEPVPVIMHGRNVRKDKVSVYDEVHAAGGILGHFRGTEMMYQILNYLDRPKLAGIMDCPEDQPFWPGDYKPFKI